MTADERRTLRAAVDSRRRELEEAPADNVNHGTNQAYGAGCRCDDCRTAATDARRQRREGERERDPRRQRLLAACADGSPIDRRVQVRAVMRMIDQAARRNGS